MQTDSKGDYLVKMSLKRALKLRKELEARVTKIELPTTMQLSLLVEGNVANPAEALTAGTSALSKKVDEYISLSRILAGLRVSIATANVTNDIEHALARAAHTTRIMSVYKKLASSSIVPDEQVSAEVNYAVQALQTQSSPGYGRPERTITLSVVPQWLRDAAADKYVAAKRSLEEVEDSRTGKNASVQIEIAEDDATLLRQLGII